MTIEQLLNKLIEKGWRPFNKDIKEFFTLNEFTCGYRGEGTNHLGTIRAIVSKESGLWQFVCENGMVNVDETEVYYFWLKRKGTLDRGHYYLSEAGEDIRINNFEYRLIESSLKDESELEDFLIQNIKVDVESN